VSGVALRGTEPSSLHARSPAGAAVSSDLISNC
jgi:hypothetical protein